MLAPGARRWRAGPPLARPMELLGADIAGGRIHAIWEHTYLIYDPATGWHSGPSPRVPRHGLAVFALGRDLLAIGGCTTDLHDSQVVERRRLAA